jgi:hypothetical protein
MAKKKSSFQITIKTARGKSTLSDFARAVGIHELRIPELEAGEEPTEAERRSIQKFADRKKQARRAA